MLIYLNNYTKVILYIVLGEVKQKFKYVAFISYRHLNVDFDIAQEIHRQIEHFVVLRNWTLRANTRI